MQNATVARYEIQRKKRGKWETLIAGSDLSAARRIMKGLPKRGKFRIWDCLENWNPDEASQELAALFDEADEIAARANNRE